MDNNILWSTSISRSELVVVCALAHLENSLSILSTQQIDSRETLSFSVLFVKFRKSGKVCELGQKFGETLNVNLSVNYSRIPFYDSFLERERKRVKEFQGLSSCLLFRWECSHLNSSKFCIKSSQHNRSFTLQSANPVSSRKLLIALKAFFLSFKLFSFCQLKWPNWQLSPGNKSHKAKHKATKQTNITLFHRRRLNWKTFVQFISSIENNLSF